MQQQQQLCHFVSLDRKVSTRTTQYLHHHRSPQLLHSSMCVCACGSPRVCFGAARSHLAHPIKYLRRSRNPTQQHGGPRQGTTVCRPRRCSCNGYAAAVGHAGKLVNCVVAMTTTTTFMTLTIITCERRKCGVK